MQEDEEEFHNTRMNLLISKVFTMLCEIMPNFDSLKLLFQKPMFICKNDVKRCLNYLILLALDTHATILHCRKKIIASLSIKSTWSRRSQVIFRDFSYEPFNKVLTNSQCCEIVSNVDSYNCFFKKQFCLCPINDA